MWTLAIRLESPIWTLAIRGWWWVPFIDQEMLPLLDHLVSLPVFVDHCLSFRLFSVGRCVVCSSIGDFWIPLWCLQSFLEKLKLNFSDYASWNSAHYTMESVQLGVWFCFVIVLTKTLELWVVIRGGSRHFHKREPGLFFRKIIGSQNNLF